MKKWMKYLLMTAFLLGVLSPLAVSAKDSGTALLEADGTSKVNLSLVAEKSLAQGISSLHLQMFVEVEEGTMTLNTGSFETIGGVGETAGCPFLISDEIKSEIKSVKVTKKPNVNAYNVDIILSGTSAIFADAPAATAAQYGGKDDVIRKIGTLTLPTNQIYTVEVGMVVEESQPQTDAEGSLVIDSAAVGADGAGVPVAEYVTMSAFESTKLLLTNAESVFVSEEETETNPPETPGETDPSQSETPGETDPSQSETPGETDPGQSETPGETDPSQSETPDETDPDQSEPETPGETTPGQSGGSSGGGSSSAPGQSGGSSSGGSSGGSSTPSQPSGGNPSAPGTPTPEQTESSASGESESTGQNEPGTPGETDPGQQTGPETPGQSGSGSENQPDTSAPAPSNPGDSGDDARPQESEGPQVNPNPPVIVPTFDPAQAPAAEADQKLTGSSYVEFSWPEVPGASGYEIYQVKSNGQDKLVASVGSSVTEYGKELGYNKDYQFKVRAYKLEGDGKTKTYGAFGDTIEVQTPKKTLEKPKVKAEPVKTTKKVSLSWKEVENADGYIVYRMNEKTGKPEEVKTLKGSDSTEYTAKNKRGETCTYEVVAFKYDKKGKPAVYSNYSLKASVTTPPVKTKKITVKSAKKNQVRISWKQTAKADGYQIWRSASENGKYVKVKTISKADTLSYTDKTVKSGQTCYYKVRAFVKADGEKVFGAYGDAKKATVK